MTAALPVNGKIVWDPSWEIAPLLPQFPICPNDFSRCGQADRKSENNPCKSKRK